MLSGSPPRKGNHYFFILQEINKKKSILVFTFPTQWILFQIFTEKKRRLHYWKTNKSSKESNVKINQIKRERENVWLGFFIIFFIIIIFWNVIFRIFQTIYWIYWLIREHSMIRKCCNKAWYWFIKFSFIKIWIF